MWSINFWFFFHKIFVLNKQQWKFEKKNCLNQNILCYQLQLKFEFKFDLNISNRSLSWKSNW